jgi:hypothetical protein
MEEALRRSLLAAKDIIGHASPEVLVAQLPHQVISELLTRALATGTFSPAQLIETAPPALLAEYLDPDLVWRCLKDVAERAGLTKKAAPRGGPGRQWLAVVLQRALDAELVSPADVLRFVPPGEFVGEAPTAVVAELIKSGLSRGSFDAALVLQHLTPTVIAEHLETSLIWSCLSEAVGRSFALDSGAKTPPPVIEKAEKPQILTGPTPKPRAAAGPITAGGRIEPAPARGNGANGANGANGGNRANAAPPSPKDIGEWTHPDDLDVLEEETIQTLPPTRARS